MACVAELLCSYVAIASAPGPRARTLPLVINTHGWVRDLGFELLQQIISLVIKCLRWQPQGPGPLAFPGDSDAAAKLYVMQIETHAQARNLPLGRWWEDSMDTGEGCRQETKYREPTIRHVRIRPVRTAAEETRLNENYNSAESRLGHYRQFINNCSHGSGHETDGSMATHIASLQAYRVPASKVEVRCLSRLQKCLSPLHPSPDSVILTSRYAAFHSSQIIILHDGSVPHDHRLHAINGMLIGLGSSTSHATTHDCIGMGFVRGINLSEDTIYVLTPLTPHEMRQVDALLLGYVCSEGCRTVSFSCAP